MNVFFGILNNLGQILAKFFSTKDTSQKTIADYKREVLVKAGKQQFEKLKDLGLNIPVNLA